MPIRSSHKNGGHTMKRVRRFVRASLGIALAFDEASATAACGDLNDWREDDLVIDDYMHGGSSDAPSGGDPIGEGEWSIVAVRYNRANYHYQLENGRVGDNGDHYACGAGPV